VAAVLAETAEFRRQVIRHDDFSLSAEQVLLRETYARLLAAHSPVERVRAVERLPDRFDRELWSAMIRLGAASLGLGTPGQDGPSLVDLAIICEQLGRAAAATPFIEAAVVGRLGEQLGGEQRELVASLLSDSAAVTSVWLHPAAPGMRQLVPCGAVADHLVGELDGRLLICAGRRAESPDNIAAAPIAWWQLDATGAVELAAGPLARRLFGQLVREWKLLTAAAVLGLAGAALDDAVRYATQREAFGVPIGAFQAVSHPLANVAVRLEAARRLAWRAAWFTDHDPAAAPELLPMAVLLASEVAGRATATSVHTQGGFGVTDDSSAQLYFRRARGWPLLAGDPARELGSIAGHVRRHAAAADRARPARETVR
jgi:alkylation response protein AidB-like acyl-CoA dehydrogenase